MPVAASARLPAAPVRANQGGVPLAASDLTVASVLKKAGYRTGCFGKWGLGDRYTEGVPWTHGFDEFFGYLHQIHAHYYYTDFLWRNGEKVILEGNRGGQKKQYSADVIAEESYKFLEKSKDQPFFLYASTTLPHVNLEPPNDGPYASRDWTPAQKHYAAMVTRADTYAGEIMRRIKEYRLDNDTIVFFTSDNGGTSGPVAQKFRSNGPYRGAKEKVDEGMYEGGIRVPMIARWPGKIRAGSKSNLPWAFWDFLPTAAEFAAIESPKVDGISVVPTLTGGRRQARHEYLYWEYHDWDFSRREFNQAKFAQAVRMGEWKVVRPNRDTPLELYNLAEDIGETHNLARQKPDLVAKAERYFKEAHVDMRPQIEPTHKPGQLYDV
jgi:arylsulfatase A